MADGTPMKPLLRALALGVGPVVMTAGMGVLGQQKQGQWLQSLAPPSVSSTTCTQPPVFKTEYQREDNGLIAALEGYKFNGLSLIQANLCSAGTLTLTASGELAGDQFPQLIVLQDDLTLAVLDFAQEKTVDIKVPHPGNIYLGYFNDYYVSEVRMASIRNLKLIGADCTGFQAVDVPRATGGEWDAQASAVSLTASAPMTLTPCDTGQLSFQIVGREGNKAFPKVHIGQDGKTIKAVATGRRSQLIQLTVSASPLTIALVNPYFLQLADRNLNVRRIEFDPQK